ncbi:PREDICTED: uncharacterized protein LOC105557119 [Vollenhovia emeryi]|uniref:uncharacterized protein LOC105557119 n=1 Tax=Vollenhovia emeryi TaxID=411798 RepID=UPI0005F50756|nr:PREDICTED: uncharacterized protein LOC105557119 [Vollenhovia emeryi]
MSTGKKKVAERTTAVDSLEDGELNKDDKNKSTANKHKQRGPTTSNSPAKTCAATDSFVSAARVVALRHSVNEHHDGISKLLLSSKESLEKRMLIESAFRECKEAFVELSTAYLNLIENNSQSQQTWLTETIRGTVDDALNDICDRLVASISDEISTLRESGDAGASSIPSYAAVTAGKSSAGPTSDPAMETPKTKTTNFIITPREGFSARYGSSGDTRDALQEAIKPSEYNLRVNRISSTKNNGVRIEALTVDLPKIKNSKKLENAGLELTHEGKVDPRLLIRGVPGDMSVEEIKFNIISLNLYNSAASKVRVVYMFPCKNNRHNTNCVIEVPPDVRTTLLKKKTLFIGYSACEVTDYVRVLQCYRCLAFGHQAKNCRFAPLCGHCAKDHETKECPVKDKRLKTLSVGQQKLSHTTEKNIGED